MTGHPGETQEDFEELCEFVREMKFERLGVFPYSHEEDTYCDKYYADDVPEDVKKKGQSRLWRFRLLYLKLLMLLWWGKETQ